MSWKRKLPGEPPYKPADFQMPKHGSLEYLMKLSKQHAMILHLSAEAA